MLSSAQISYCRPRVAVSSVHGLQRPLKGLRLVSNVAYHRRSSPVCFSGGRGKSGNNKDSSPWKGLEELVGGLKDLTIQNFSRERKQALEFDNDGGGDGGFGNRPGGRGGNGGFGNRPGGSAGDGFDNSDAGFILGIVDELVQMMLATLGLVCVYIYILRGEELTRLAKDYIKYLFGSKKSQRLKRTMALLRSLKRGLTKKKEMDIENWLEILILNTPTLWHRPHALRQVLLKVIDDLEKGVSYDSDEIISKTPKWWHMRSRAKPTPSAVTTDSKVPDDSDMLDDDSDMLEDLVAKVKERFGDSDLPEDLAAELKERLDYSNKSLVEGDSETQKMIEDMKRTVEKASKSMGPDYEPLEYYEEEWYVDSDEPSSDEEYEEEDEEEAEYRDNEEEDEGEEDEEATA